MLSAKGDPKVAIVALKHGDGSVVAMVGGRAFAENQFNLGEPGQATGGLCIEAFVLVAALERGIKRSRSSAPTRLSSGEGRVWPVQSSENSRPKESASLLTATEQSMNAVYARLIMKVGPERVVKVASKMGIVTPLEADPAIALGGLKTGVSPLEMASAYGTIANGGYRAVPTGIGTRHR